ncbi:MAG: TOBE domain-containing protein, partial [Paracoccus sp. (in: a-proteobacteria)]|nr:TOBE domain-containing protein [Paracoccus sp. (in: a-proteobacteria)]
THDQIEAMTMADKIVVMKDGRVEQIGAPLDLYDHPESVFVAGFIGSPSMNFLHGTMATRDGRRVFSTDSGLDLPVPAIDLPDGTAVTSGIRPEHIGIGPVGIPVNVVVTEPTGSETQVFARVGSDLIDAVVKDRIRAEPGQQVGFVIDPAHVHLFDRQSEKRITGR